MQPFYIPAIPEGAEYVSRQALVETYAPDMDQILNEIQLVDDRWTAEDIQRICETPPRPELAAFFEIEDWHEAKGSFEALRSMSLFALDGVSVDKYIDGVEHQVRHVQPEFPEILLRYYVSGEMWEACAKRDLIGMPGAEFVKMRHASRYSRMGTFWRFLGLNDDRFEIVFTSDVEIGEFNPTIEYIEKRVAKHTKTFDWYGSVLFLRDEIEHLSSNHKDDLQFFFYTALHGDAIFIEDLSSLNRFSGKGLMCGPCKILPNLIPLICEYLSTDATQILYHPQTHRWSSFREREPRLGGGQYGFMNEFFPRLLTKVVPMRMMILKSRYPALVRIFRRYGANCLLRRLYHQLSIEGHDIIIHREDGTLSNFDDDIYL